MRNKQPDSKNRSNTLFETLINMNSWTWEGGKKKKQDKNISVNQEPSSVGAVSATDGLDRLSGFWTPLDKTSQSSCNNLLHADEFFTPESVRRFRQRPASKPAIIRAGVSIMAWKTKLRFAKSGNQLTMTKAPSALSKRCSWGRFQKQANKQLRSSQFTLGAIKRRRKQDTK